MIEPPGITDSPARQTAVIHLTVPRTEIQQVMGPGIQEVLTTLWEVYLTDPATWRTELNLPLAG